ncbi:MAG: FliA/WhiG family RNA polymerase sigma factor [Candidatus Magnetobacterium sp. LHC-1]|uniref:RNA polymerase sigma factor n=1 Tax=Candidatus Magnetobacterium casense TaxID=1455061 RepID=A0ABS6RXQ5_9BACT|nr:FliA/WhiG family RNA polymerase sigma factor [Candidatus Magnetobacterium casensis]MBF0608250.1 FliA/WhiG family RNA polymerase sigma factor [Nitrospirota bacterium]MBV6341140.1 FliA/WhiG family RNA polymerase sigma factor [Candidatus Magnetobacterium casensis]
MGTKVYKAEISNDQREEVIKDFLPFIKYTAFRLLNRIPPQLTVDDLISVGIIGLLDALENYDPTKSKLKTFAEFRIKGAMLDELRNFDTASRSLKEKVCELKGVFVNLEKTLGRAPEDEEVAAELKISLDGYYKILKDADSVITLRFEDFSGKLSGGEDINMVDNIPDTSGKDPLAQLIELSQRNTLARLIDGLPYKEKMVLSLYYWDELTMKEIGKVLSLSEGRVCQLHSQAILRMKAMLTASNPL